MGTGVRLEIVARSKLSFWTRLSLAAQILIKGEGRFFDSQCRIVRGVTGVQDAPDQVRQVAQEAYDTVMGAAVPPDRLPPD